MDWFFEFFGYIFKLYDETCPDDPASRRPLLWAVILVIFLAVLFILVLIFMPLFEAFFR